MPAVQQQWKPNLFVKQWEAVEVCQRQLPNHESLVLLSGPRYSSKTVVCCHILCLHAWLTNRGNILVLTLTQSIGVDSGVWQDIIEVMGDWIAGDFGMKWVRKPYLDSGTKKPAFIVTNRYNTHTKVQLDSLKNEEEVEQRYKGKRYSMIFVNELSKFKKRKTFDTLKQALRMMHLKEQEHLFLADTNPDLDLGTNSPWYHLWYEFRVMNESDIEEFAKPGTESAEQLEIKKRALLTLRNSLRLVEFTIDDNLAISPEKKASLMGDFSHDEDLLAAYYYGKWVTASADALFFKVFRPHFHVIGDPETKAIPDPEIMVPEPGTFELFDGYDLGVTNSAAVIMEKTFRTDRIKTKIEGQEVTVERRVPVFKVLDELVIIGEDFSMDDFIEEFMKKREFWEAVIGRPNKTRWTSWSDRSAFDMRDPSSERFHHQVVFQASNGKIILQAAERGGGSVADRVDLFRKLLYDERIYMSRAKCPHVINMCRSIKRGKSSLAIIAKGSRFKHAFDAVTYVAASECYDELARNNINNMKKVGETTFIQSPL